MQGFKDFIELCAFLGFLLIAFNVLYYVDEQNTIKRVCRILMLDPDDLVDMEPKSIEEENFFKNGVNVYKHYIDQLDRTNKELPGRSLNAEIHHRLSELDFVRRWMKKRFDRSKPITLKNG